MATGQTLLDTMEVLNAELQLQTGEADVTRALTALNRSQDYLESILASEPGVVGSVDVSTASTTADTESTTLSTSLLRIDAVWRLDSDTFKPKFELLPLRKIGSHYPSVNWLDSLIVSSGEPRRYWANGTKIYWSPLPDQSGYLHRIYGLAAAADIAVADTFGYDDVAILPVASFACRLMKIGIDDDQVDVATLAENTFRPLIKSLANFNRDGARPLQYRDYHNT